MEKIMSIKLIDTRQLRCIIAFLS